MCQKAIVTKNDEYHKIIVKIYANKKKSLKIFGGFVNNAYFCTVKSKNGNEDYINNSILTIKILNL
jgi:hypothetical protein